MNNILLLAAFAGAFILSRSFMKCIIELSDKYRLYDKTNTIKLHQEKVSSLGGVAIFSVFWLLAFVMVKDEFLPRLFTGSLLLFLVGLKDDLLGVHAWLRLVVQMLVAGMLIYGGMVFPQFTLAGFTAPWWLSAGLTVVFALGVINAWNFIDGSNGLAAGLTLIGASTFCGYFFIMGKGEMAVLACLLIGSMLGFAVFNFSNQARAFMGDNGSTFSGLVLAFLAVKFIQEGKGLPVSHASLIQLSLAPLVVPVLDMVRVVLVRLAGGRSPFKGDRSHIHHLMKVRGFSPLAIAIVLGTIQWLLILFAVTMPLGVFLVVAAALIAGFVYYLWHKKVNVTGQHKLERLKHPEEYFSKVAP